MALGRPIGGERKTMNDLGGKAYYHLPGLFEFYELYRVFLPLFREHRAYFYDWCEIGSIYGAPADCIWGGGRAGFGDQSAKEVRVLLREYGISARLLCVLHHQGPDGVCPAAQGAGTGRVPLCGAGFPSEQSV